MWRPTEMSASKSREKSRFLALAIAYALKLKATVRQTKGVQDRLVVRIPLSPAAKEAMSGKPYFDSNVVARATTLCQEG